MKRIFLIFAFACAALSARAEILLPPQFSHNMVLQRGINNRIWGERTSSEQVWIEFRPGASQKKTSPKKARMRKEPQWDFEIEIDPKLTPQQANAPGSIWFWESKKAPAGSPPTLVLTNVVIGDVWFVAMNGSQGMVVPIARSVQCRLLEAPDLRLLRQPGPGGVTAWNSSPREMHLLAIEFAFQLSANRAKDGSGFPVGVIQVEPVVLMETFGDQFQTRRPQDVLPDFQRIQQFAVDARRESNRQIARVVHSNEQDRIDAKHDGKMVPAARFLNYGDFQTLAGPGELKDRLMNFEGAIRPVDGN